MALKKDGSWDKRFRFDHVDTHDEMREVKRMAKKRAIYEKKYGRSYHEKEMAEMMRPNRRLKYSERKALKKNQAVIPGHRQFYIDTLGFVYRMCGRIAEDIEVPLAFCHRKRPKKSAPGGEEKQLFVQLWYKDHVNGYDRRTGEEIIVDKPGHYFLRPHILVMHLFGPDKPNDGRGYFVGFKNGDRFDPRLSNLFWCPVSERFKKWREVIPTEQWSQRGKKISEKGRENMRVRKGKRKTIR